MAIVGSRWGDEDDDVLPPRTESEPDAQGVRTVVEWKYNDKDQKVKVTKKVKKVTEVTRVSKRALERKVRPRSLVRSQGSLVWGLMCGGTGRNGPSSAPRSTTETTPT